MIAFGPPPLLARGLSRLACRRPSRPEIRVRVVIEALESSAPPVPELPDMGARIGHALSGPIGALRDADEAIPIVSKHREDVHAQRAFVLGHHPREASSTAPLPR